MRNDQERPRTANEELFLFVGPIGGMMRRGQDAQAQSLADLLERASRSNKPALEAREIAAAALAWSQIYERSPATAIRLAHRVIDGESAKLQTRLDMPPPAQPQRRAAAPKPRGP
jgi:hypothetical protein